MKKALAVLVLALFVGTAAFAVPAFGLSAGAGGIFTKAFGGGFEGSLMGMTMKMEMPSLGGGAFAFLDATFVELDINFTYNAGTATYSVPGYSEEYDFNFSAIGFGLLGKYPFVVGPVDIYPMIGIEYRYVLSLDVDTSGVDMPDASDWSRFSVRFGAGLDYYLSPALFLRAEVLYAIGFESKAEKDLVDDMNYQTGLSIFESIRSHGPDIKIAVGYRFF
jgi:opacity protein-like surface antigen